MIKQFIYLIFFAFAIHVVAQPTVDIEAFGPAFNRPVNIKNAGDNRLFIVEQDGLVQILNTDGTKNNTPFIDIQSLVINLGGIGDERGLLGLAFHPQYSTNGFFYLNYINNSGDTVVSRFSVSSSNANLADVNSELILLTITQPASNHNGGDMAFGSDGYLYISSGDGGGSGDQTDQGQDLGSLLGKLLRIDVDNTGNGNNYAIPASNPFVGTAAALDEIWAYGLRNPWKFSFDRQTDELWIADVGQGGFEEINMMPSTAAGINYGWRCYEGDAPFNTSGCANMSTMTFPVATIAHSSSSFCSITGGYRYRGSQHPDLNGLYFFADYCSTEIGVLEENGTNWDMTLKSFAGNNWVAFGEDVNGELYIADINGAIYKINGGALSIDDLSLANFKMYPNPVAENINFDFSNSITPERISFYDTQGRLIKRIKEIPSNNVTISIDDFKEGLYFVEILASNGKKTNKKLLII